MEKVILHGDFDALPSALEAMESLRHERGGAIFTGNFPEWADKQISLSRKKGVAIVTLEDSCYPDRLRRLPDPPISVFSKGDLEPEDPVAVAIVGSRRPTTYGRHMATMLARDLSRRGVTVVSGLARGIDSAAHEGALAADGRTVAVLGCGLDTIYPAENRDLYRRIPTGGAVVTEYPHEAGPLPRHFPQRNRIIAALSDAVIVVEAAPGSGSLITADLALDTLGIPVGAVPGQVTSKNSVGCNDLIHDGAAPIRDADDVIDTLPVRLRAIVDSKAVAHPVPTPEDLEDGARTVLMTLDTVEGRAVDDLSRRLEFSSGELLAHLTELEIRGLAERGPDGRYLKKT